MNITGMQKKLNNHHTQHFNKSDSNDLNTYKKSGMLNNTAKSMLMLHYQGMLNSSALAFKARSSIEVDNSIEDQFEEITEKILRNGHKKQTRDQLFEKLSELQDTYTIEDRVKRVKGKKYQGEGLFSDGYVDFKKVGWDKLKKEPINWEKAKQAEVMALWHATALAETYTDPWVRRYNYFNVSQPLATYHSLDKHQSREVYAEALNDISQKIDENSEQTVKDDILKDLNDTQAMEIKRKALQRISASNEEFLDKPIIDPETGDFNLEITVFDTETTGLNIDHEMNQSFREDKSVARIVEIGAVKLNKDGSVKSEINQLVNPEAPIEEGAAKVHGIYYDENDYREKTGEEPPGKDNQDVRVKYVKDQPTMRQVLTGNFGNNPNVSEQTKEALKGGILKFLNGGGPIVAYNAKFDIPMLNSEIGIANRTREQRPLEEKNYSLALDPFIITQRIHPFVGSSKKLSNQYRYFFGRELEGAHDALADVKATVDMLKYNCHYLNKHYTPPEGSDKKGLTVRDVLRFQFGEEVKGLDIKLHKNYGHDKSKKFHKSYRIFPVGSRNFPGPYEFDPNPHTNKERDKAIRAILIEEIGERNLDILNDTCAKRIPPEKQKYDRHGNVVNAKGERIYIDDENRVVNKKGRLIVRQIKYKEEKNLDLYLYGTGVNGDTGVPFEPYNGKSPKELKDLFKGLIKSYESDNYIAMWMKDIRPETVAYGNDLPDVEIVKKVMGSRK